MSGLFSKILIANRGEIACRIVATARRLGVRSVAVYSDADAGALHVVMADQAVRIGPPPAADSYLNAGAIIAAAKATGAEAIHPGYGFLSENPRFVEAVEAAGLVFIGPSAGSMRAMGLKDAAKTLMEKAGVPVVPGYHGEAQATVVLAGKADEIGYPVLIKAAAGGGGKGMRRVDRPSQFREALAAAKREALAAFGDDRVLVEKYIGKPRHIEVQVFGDAHGNVVHLFERDCSLQRRHQKVIEEAPAPGMTDEMRRAMTAAAVRAAHAIDYVGAGTVEFIVDAGAGLRPDGFWFMEMNTRLQVEHPVTETVTGLDLVEWQLRVAAGEELPLKQEAIVLDGHAIEARLYAEDAGKGFLPATGRLSHLRFPDNARVDSGVRQGDEITPFYDPMIAKIIVGAPSRREAIDRLAGALARTELAGSVTNRAFLARLCAHDGFRAGEVDTGLIERELEWLVARPDMPAEAWGFAALAALGLTDPRAGDDPFDMIGNWALWQTPIHPVDLDHAGARHTLAASPDGAGWSVQTPAGLVRLSVNPIGDGRHELASVDRRLIVSLARWPGHLALFAEGEAFEFVLPDPLAGAMPDHAGGDRILAPMPGLVRIVNAAAGDTVSKGAPLVVLEAMKMEHALAAPRDGTVQEVVVSPGDQVADGDLLVSLAPQG
ncbi:MAG: 3-methylcrotonyl-CoA carboxylase subunit alpha [Alphaproteobacteria bacterium]|nr:MAG: 3-methylcrotonyl-CoA carboxylase subunit alpha [Alphaproteobacteria bacterium]